MNQILHILRKDIRHLWPQIAIFVALVAAFAILDIRYSPLIDPDLILPLDPLSVVEFILPLAAWYLIAAAILEEPLPADREFWLTRPYGRGKLLASKTLFAAVAVSLPLFIADLCILGFQHLPVIASLGLVAARQLTIAIWLILPAFAMAAVTNGFGQYAMAWLLTAIDAAVIIFLRTAIFYRSGGQDWIGGLWILCLAGTAMLLVSIWRQYTGRQTATNRALLAGALLLPALPLSWNVAVGIRSQLGHTAQGTDAIGLTQDLKRDIGSIQSMDPEAVCADIPLAVTGLKDGWSLLPAGAKGVVKSNPEWKPTVRLNIDPRGAAHITTCAKRSAIPADHARLSTLHASLLLEVIEDQPAIRVPVQRTPFFAPGVGRCEVIPFRQHLTLLCKDPVRPPPMGMVSVQSPGHHVESRISFSTFVFAPMGLLAGFSPVFEWSTLAGATPAMQAALDHPGPEFVFTPQKTIGYIERDLTIPNIRW